MSPDRIDKPDPSAHLGIEWLLTNGLGGYAMGTAPGINTRRYHGLLVAAAAPSVRRIVVLSSMIEQLVIGDETIELSTFQFADSELLHPEGWRYLTQFQAEPNRSVRWTWRSDGFELSRTIHLVDGENAVRIEYQINCERDAYLLRLRPLMPLRNFHELSCESDPQPSTEVASDGLQVSLDSHLALLHSTIEGTWRVEPQWWRSVAYAQDRARGQDWTEDIWSPGVFELSGDVTPQTFDVRVHLDVPILKQSGGKGLLDNSSGPTLAAGSIPSRLARAAEQFVVRRDDDSAGASIIAGYPWFADWGRDAMISLPGLLISTGRIDDARRVLSTFGAHLRRGLIPNRFDDMGGEPHYESIDASLWFVHAVGVYAAAINDELPNDLIDACRTIIAAYRNGTDFGIRQCPDGLIAGSESSGHHLTWMDGARDGVVFTPRHGKPIEISALWHNALHVVAQLTNVADEAAELRELAGHTALSFQMNFWWPQCGCCHDVLKYSDEGWIGDEQLRPNQIFAVSLPYSPLTSEQQRAVVQVVQERLLTPYGLRTLDPDDPQYRGRYEGDMHQRDAAYHQGTVWPWLIGPFCEALLKVNNYSDDSTTAVRQMIQPLLQELDQGCLGHVAEVYDGDPPHRSNGCPAQAWSITELLRVLSLLEQAQRNSPALHQTTV